MDILNRAYTQLVELFRSMAPGARLATATLAIVVLFGAGYLYTHQGVLPEVDLMRGVPVAADQLPRMEAAFAKANLNGYEVRGTTIFVPRGQESVYMAALVAAKALPQGLGAAQHEAVNNSNVFDLGAQRDARMKVAKQEMLAQAIGKIRGIESAWVEYDIAARSDPFKPKTITATVMVQPAASGRLDAALASSIREMVAHAIAGLKPENVAVTDLTAGHTWSGAIEPSHGDDTAKPEHAAVAPLPPGDDAKQASEPVTIAAAPDATPLEWSMPELRDEVLNVLRKEWRAVAAVALGLVVLMTLRSMVRTRPVAADANRSESTAEQATDDAMADAGEAVVPTPHAKRFHSPGAPLREELSALVEEDPDAAANVLRSWIGQVG